MDEIDTLIVSDVHLGSEVSRAVELLRLLKSITFRRLILLGDINDNSDSHRLKSEHWQVLSHFRWLTKKSRGIQVVWVSGNHDRKLRPLFEYLLGVEAVDQYMFEIGGKQCIAIHGDVFDIFYTSNRKISDVAGWAYNKIQHFDNKKKSISKFLKRRSKSWVRATAIVERGAVKYAEANKAQVIFCGHTHRACDNQHGKVRYVNTGCWTEIPQTYVTITVSGVITVHEQWEPPELPTE